MKDIYVAFINGVFLLLVPLVTIYIDRYLKARKYNHIDIKYRKIVHGKWRGYFKQIFNDQELVIDLVLTIKVLSTGMVNGTANFTFGETKFKMIVNGGFYLHEFLKMNYTNSKKEMVQFGAFVFKIDYQSKTLSGHFAGYGPKSKKVISGPAYLEKVAK